MSACTCNPPHPRSDHRNGVGRCTRPGCPCLYGPPPARRTVLPRPTEHGIGHVDAHGVVQDFKRPTRESDRTKLENMLARKINEAGLPVPETQYLWARPERLFRSDFAWPAHRILAEVQGGIWAADPGRHNRGSGYERDLERSNLAVVLGWRMLAFTERHIKSGYALETIRHALAPCDSHDAIHQLALTGGGQA